MTITGKVDDILRHKYPIQLEDIFKETKGRRKVILLEGAPGCGKSTLSVYICQHWEKGQLFNQFKLVILIRLRDPAIGKAKGLADLL
ncbi:MAG: NACHT domain-containing protein, partial [Proteobacteria bacterium]|nr:NACHT domain-containing protein [Pseudomonadota bacterium]